MPSKILLKKSTTASQVPTTSDVDVGEVAVNTEDKRLFTQDNGGSVVELGTTPSSITTTGTVQFGSLSDGTITVTGFADEDTMSSDSATLIPTQQSVKAYVDTEITNLIDGSDGALDTLNELAAALGDDPNFATTVTDSIATKAPLASPTLTGTPLAPTAAADTNTTQIATTAYVQTELGDYAPLAGATFTGDVVLGANKATSTATPATDDTLTRKGYVDTQDATKLSLSGGTMTGAIDMGSSKITTTYTPTDNADLTTKTYVDSILGSATSAEAALTDFDSVYQRDLPSAPGLDRNGNALTAGDLYFDTTENKMYVHDGTSWGPVAVVPADFLQTSNNLSDLGSAATALTNLGLTSTAAELNTLDGYTGSVTDLNRLDVAVEGLSQASKVVTASSTGQVVISGTFFTANGFYLDGDNLTSSSGSLTIDVGAANSFALTLTEDISTVSFSNTSSSYSSAFVLRVVQDSSGSGYTITWPSTTRWAGGTAPTLTDSANAIDVIALYNVGSVWYGFVVGQDMQAEA